jgi:Putative auto-transporter adhesin, head GIN domain
MARGHINWSSVMLLFIVAWNGQTLGEVQVRELPPFNSMSNCAPFSILVRASTAGEAPYSMTIDADPEVISVIYTTVDQQWLGIEANKSFSTSNPVKVTVRLPEKTLLYAETLLNGKADMGIKMENFADQKGEIITNADGNVMVTGLNGGLTKLSTSQ